LVEQRTPALLKRWTLDNVITLTSDESHNVRDHSRNSMDVSRTCANRTLRESSVSLSDTTHCSSRPPNYFRCQCPLPCSFTFKLWHRFCDFRCRF